MAQAAVIMKRGLTLVKEITGQMSCMYAQMAHTMKTNPFLSPMYKWWEGRFWLKEESCYLNRGRARIYTYLALFLYIRSRSAKNKAEMEEMKVSCKDEIIATAQRVARRP